MIETIEGGIFFSLHKYKEQRNALIYFAFKMFCFLTLKVQTFNLKETYTKYEGFPSFFKEITGKYMISHVDVVLVVSLFNLMPLISFLFKVTTEI